MVSSKILSSAAVVTATICAIGIPVVVIKAKSRSDTTTADINLIQDPYGPADNLPTSLPSSNLAVVSEESLDRESTLSSEIGTTSTPTSDPGLVSDNSILTVTPTVTASSGGNLVPPSSIPTSAPLVIASGTHYPTIDTLWKACKVGNSAVKASVPNSDIDLFFSCHLVEFNDNSNICEWPLAGPNTVTKTWVWQVCPTQCYNQSGCFSRPDSPSGPTSASQPTQGDEHTNSTVSTTLTPVPTPEECSNEGNAQVTLFGGTENELQIECQFIGVSMEDKVCSFDHNPSTPVWSICQRECWKQSGCADKVLKGNPSTDSPASAPPSLSTIDKTDSPIGSIAPTSATIQTLTKPAHCQHCSDGVDTFKIQDPDEEEVTVELACSSIGLFVEPIVCAWENLETPGLPIWNTCCDQCSHVEEAHVCSASDAPSEMPSRSPTSQPTGSPSHSPSKSPSNIPTFVPSDLPSYVPSPFPTGSPSALPSISPTESPTSFPTGRPSAHPTSWCTSDEVVSFDTPGEERAQIATIPCSSIGFYIESSVCGWSTMAGSEEPVVWLVCREQCSDLSGCIN